jgi:preprotein translocase subunit SecG
MAKVNLKLSAPASIALLAYTAVVLAVLLPFDIGHIFDVDSVGIYNDSSKYNVLTRLAILVFLMIPISLSIYTINCLVVGRCYTWSYIQAALVVLWVVLILAMVFAATLRPKRLETFAFGTQVV